MVKILDKTCEILAVAGALLLLFVTFSIGYSIFSRQVGITSPIWVIQFNEYSLLWITFLGTAWLLANDKHVSIHLLTDRLGAKAQKSLEILHNVVGAGLCGVFAWFGFWTTKDHLVRNIIDTQAIDVSKGLILAVIPLGFFLLFLQFLKKLYLTITKENVSTSSQ